jgi:hypothetical protein
LELVSLPNVLFLDEPTSGLDATASLEILGSLAEMAKLGMTVASVIHQPRFSLFKKFENAILMGKGKPVYVGPTKDALQYFETELGLSCPFAENPADFFLDMISQYSELTMFWRERNIIQSDPESEVSQSKIELFKKNNSRESILSSQAPPSVPDFDVDNSFGSGKNYPSNITELSAYLLTFFSRLVRGQRDIRFESQDLHAFQQKQIHDMKLKELMEDLPPKKLPSVFQQFGYQLVRSSTQLIYGASEIGIELILVLIAGFAVGNIFGNNWSLERFPTIANLSNLGIGLTSICSSLRILYKDRLVFWRESQSGVSITSFFFAKLLAQLYQVFLLPFIYAVIVHEMIVPDIPFLYFYGIMVLIAWDGSGLGLFLSVAVEQSAMLASIILSLILGGFLGGNFPALNTLTGVLKFVSNLSFNRWATEAMMVLEFRGLPPQINSDTLFLTGYAKDKFALDLISLFLIGLVLRISTLLALRFKRRNFNFSEWLLELRSWLTMPLGITGLALSVLFWITKPFDFATSTIPLHVSIWSYVFFAFNVHYYAFYTVFYGRNCKLDGLTLLNVDLAVHSPLWVIFQWIGDFMLALFSLFWIGKNANIINLTFFQIAFFPVSSLIIKILGFAIRMSKQRKNLMERRFRKMSSGVFYIFWLILCIPSMFLLAINLENPNEPRFPVVTCSFPIFMLILKTLWNSLNDFLTLKRFMILTPLFISEFIALLIFDLKITQIPVYAILIPLGIYGLFSLVIILDLAWKVLKAMSILCCRGCSRRSLKILFS